MIEKEQEQRFTTVLMDTASRIQKSWDVRRGQIHGVLDRGETLVESLKLIEDLCWLT